MKKNGSGSRSSSASSSSGNESSRYKRIKLDSSSEIEGSPSSTELVTSSSNNNTPPATANMKTQAAFVNKLYKMLEDPDTSDLIAWSSHGDLFSVSNPTAFSKTVLPQYFKHNNWQSFVRQLNMYGFHKVNDLIHSNLTNENQTWEFKHPNFRRGAVGDLQYIKRKSPKNHQSILRQQQRQREQEQQQEQEQEQQAAAAAAMAAYAEEQQQNEEDTIIKYILRIEEHLVGVSTSCERLFNEVVHLRMVVSKQQDAMQDLVDVVSSLSSPNNSCQCGSGNNSNKNKQDLQNAENLRLQVSKLKSSQYSYYDNNNNKLPSFDSLQYSNDNNNNENYSKNNTSRYSSSTNPDSSKKSRSSAMSFGKQSHMLNPMEGQRSRK